ncbi:sigma-54-dependent transcriptional regulator [Chrysiogenes arsenatis]|uniref:sigma-54-dependent transcriptional regulator n=1 Tax=Chrysiogenes arsenatis TaxID=309797 RepID=UPI0003FC2013|nr:sigma-54 dependent transcriptional regulator [Chrysiogenes arsenatis]
MEQDIAILVVDDEEDSLFSTKAALYSAGFRNLQLVSDPRLAVAAAQKHRSQVAIIDLIMPHMSGQELLGELSLAMPDTVMVMMTAVNDVDTALGCMKSGAFDYLVKPVDKKRLLATVEKAIEVSGLRGQLRSLQHMVLDNSQVQHNKAFSRIVSQSSRMHALFRYIEAISCSPQPVLINGETGTGKELFAEAVHCASGRTGQFVAVNIAGLDDTMFSDTLFGHVKGAFTGAERSREGLIAQAENGTLFLDEIGELSEASQVKLLRLLQDRRYYPVGSDSLRSTNARVVLATNRDLIEATTEGVFRKDLLYRIRTHSVIIPPLRDRPEDIPLLLNHFVERTAESYQRPAPTIAPELVSFLRSYAFPGNVRELETLVFDAVARCGERLELVHMAANIREHSELHSSLEGEPVGGAGNGCVLSGVFGYFPTLKEVEDFAVSAALTLTDGVQSKAASLLGISKQALSQKLKKGNGSVNAD